MAPNALHSGLEMCVDVCVFANGEMTTLRAHAGALASAGQARRGSSATPQKKSYCFEKKRAILDSTLRN